MTNLTAHLFVDSDTTVTARDGRLGDGQPWASVTIDGGAGRPSLSVISEDGEDGAETLDRLAAAFTEAAARIRAAMTAEAVQS